MHIDIRYHYIREAIINNSISVVQFPTEENILTKGLDKLKHYKRIEMLGLKKIGKIFTWDHSVSLVSKNKSETYVCQVDYSQFNRYKYYKLFC